MTWQSVGTHSFVPTDKAVQVGSFDLAAGQDTIWVRITQLNDPGDWPWSYGILSWQNANGTPLGSIKAYSNRLGEVFRLGNGLAPLDGVGSIWFEPRGYNLGWLKAGFPWELKFEAQSGVSDLTSGYWNRDPVNAVLAPRTPGDDFDLGTGDLSAAAGTFSGVLKTTGAFRVGAWSNDRTTSINLGTIQTRRDNDDNIFVGYKGGDAGANQTIEIRSNGTIKLGGTLPASPNIELRADGAILGYGASNLAGFTLLELKSDLRGTRTSTFTFLANGTAEKPGGGSWTAISDARTKEAVVDYSPGLAELRQIQPRSYRYIGNDHAYIGLIAQEAEGVMPELVTQGVGTLPDGTEVDDFRTLDQTPLTFALINAVKEMATRIEALEARLATLQGN